MPDFKKLFNFTTHDIPRPRWNVLDMINVINKGTVPTLVTCEIDMTWAENLRSELKKNGYKTTVTAILLKAIAVAQRSHPETRTARLPWGRLVTFRDIVAGFTVERFIGSQPAVFFGAIENADTKPVTDIAKELSAYASSDVANVDHLDVQNRFNNMPWLFRRFILFLGRRYPAIRLKYMNATFGLSTLGKFGVRMLVPPNVTTSTFGVGAVEDRAVVRDGKIEIRPMMTLALNFDHTVIDGAPAARFMSDIRNLMEGGLEDYLKNELGSFSVKAQETMPAAAQ
ncbi:2-oxo acid dehydrogenase subunit E2 [Candidatus Obscuribacterales bacterium]|nr:2-oxo acid dehydrogenase subunit E2 [Candidatus Obscuribacterales bacterium]MBX3135405.1 2-oxo acid dehydrogenase subunit E2 [Candidatus Obscuribacterales bacterium]MBX3149261.1 2-oxo acid dehydrogenase subunit E2 [Candidatus Obscuribacterales bacterium]